MRTLGLVGGTSWHSTIEYYRNINETINQHFGNNTNPPLVLYNLNQALIHQLQKKDKWNDIAELISAAAIRLQNAGAEAVMFCANTPHKVYDSVESQLNVPIIHIADATANAIKKQGLSKVCLIGTRFSMEQDFLTNRFSKNGIEVIVPDSATEIDELHRIIQEELTFGKIVPKSKQFVLDAIKSMVDRSAEGVILGCTEFPLMICREDLKIPAFDTTQIHSQAAAEFVLG